MKAEDLTRERGGEEGEFDGGTSDHEDKPHKREAHKAAGSTCGLSFATKAY